jgi:hypothetical protein
VTILQLCGRNVVAGKTKPGWVRDRDDDHANIRIQALGILNLCS